MAHLVQPTLDHLAVAVRSLEVARRRWRSIFGGGIAGRTSQTGLETIQYQYANGGRVELVAPAADHPGPQLVDFLARRGSAVHHITIKVSDLSAMTKRLRSISIEVIGSSFSGLHWRETYLSPRQTGLVAIQVAWTDSSLAESAMRNGVSIRPPDPHAGDVLGLWCAHPDLRRVAELFGVLGGTVDSCGNGVDISWAESPLHLWVAQAGGHEDRAHPAQVVVRGMPETTPGDPLLVSVPAAMPDSEVGAYLCLSM